MPPTIYFHIVEKEIWVNRDSNISYFSTNIKILSCSLSGYSLRQPLLLWNIPSCFKIASDLEVPYFALHISYKLTQLLRMMTQPSNCSIQWVDTGKSLCFIAYIVFRKSVRVLSLATLEVQHIPSGILWCIGDGISGGNQLEWPCLSWGGWTRRSP